ncbi:hypothetical protein [Kitasatospora purpeofusca]|uniref:hypothetical protein n=1 Tax=Kitasatospora purpeofusca TaxID=67352 RepID=UPI00225A2B1D|nr:hypothetical protein [Kitasatospora purpeofusca]MCX4752539.1 hypothetical protein [Kitasatospora purpeofusca]WSR32109.1 hypothetical protein OG715_14595 [Kitasatospora purpeofusca]
MIASAAGLNLSDMEIDCAKAVCDLLAAGEDDSGFPIRELYVRLTGRFGRDTVKARLTQLIATGSVRLVRGKLHDTHVELADAGHVGLLLFPMVTDTLNHQVLMEVLTYFMNGLEAPGAEADELRQKLRAFRGLVHGRARALREVIVQNDVPAAIELGKVDTKDLADRIGLACARAVDNLTKVHELADDLDRMITAVTKYIGVRGDLTELLRREARLDRKAELHTAALARAAKSATIEELAALWDGIHFDSVRPWLDPAAIECAVEELLLEPAADVIPQRPDRDAVPLPEPQDHLLRAIADELLGEHDEIDLTPILLSRPWHSGSELFCKLIELSSLDPRYRLHSRKEPPQHGDPDPFRRRPSWVTPMSLRRAPDRRDPLQ